MNKKRGIQTVLMILLLGNIALSNIITYRHLAPQKYLDYQYETQVRTQSNSGGLDVGKAD
ncbi:PhrA family quorum-sensing system peptide [Streptococcus suis]|uniref:PhrA family quorum-sensing system peptide n=1 Tax=Streptococcus suis TaxID=1307 RepID=UPI00094237C5|nr:PhrA family quorum-sensing system peptide [Streptococcus suis]HEL2365915.1 hypothetical protein [Streptococcus suis]HEL2468078.1 hypothetical protein [Streptococcus suis]HEL2668419.1 hypothetical protein [Streptococcus suis]HEL2731397.1 hypothetical protein [Streptococcus suis]HEM4042905.1 hypothetical protein [Streptococcus suis]